MSKIIQQTGKSQRGQIESMNRTHGSEMKAINESFQQKKSDLKINNEAAIVEIQNQNLKQVDSEQTKKEKILAGMRQNLEDTKIRTDKQLDALKTSSETKTKDTYAKNSVDLDRINQQNETSLEDMNEKFNDQSRKIRYEGQSRLSQMHDAEKEKFSRLKDDHTLKVQGQTHDFNKRYTHDELKYREFKELQDKTFDKERKDQNLRQTKDVARMTAEQDYQIQTKEKNFRKGIKEQDVALEKQWHDTMKKHTENFKNLDQKHAEVVSKVKTDMTTEVSQIVKRSDDQFYQFTELKPVVTQFPDRVEIKIDVPEHSKQDMQLTTNTKEAIVVFNRRYQDSNKNELGSAKVSRVESFTSKIDVGAVLDPKSVKSTYESGTMTYVIKKA